MLPPKLARHSSIFREVACCLKDGISAFHSLQPETKLPALATSLTFPEKYSRASAPEGAQVTSQGCSGDQRSGSISLLCTSSHIQRASQMSCPSSRRLENTFLCLPPPHCVRRHPPTLSTPNAFELCSDEKKAEKAHFQSRLPEEPLENLPGRFFLQISFQVIADLAVGHLANPQRTQIKTPHSPAS